MTKKIRRFASWERLIILYKLCVGQINLPAESQSAKSTERKRQKWHELVCPTVLGHCNPSNQYDTPKLEATECFFCFLLELTIHCQSSTEEDLFYYTPALHDNNWHGRPFYHLLWSSSDYRVVICSFSQDVLVDILYILSFSMILLCIIRISLSFQIEMF